MRVRKEGTDKRERMETDIPTVYSISSAVKLTLSTIIQEHFYKATDEFMVLRFTATGASPAAKRM
jgi:hypothetical protein